MYCNLLLMASLSTMWTVIVGLLAVVTLVSIVLFILKSREVTTLKKEVEELRDTMRMMRYEEINLSRMLHTVDKEDLTPNNPSEMDSLTPNPSPEERGTAGIAEVPEETFSEEPVAEEPVAEEPIAEEPVADEPVADEPVADEPVAEEPVADEPIAEEPIAEEPIAEEPIAEEPIAEDPIVEELNVEVVDEAIESPTEIQESPIVEGAASSPLSGRGVRGEADEPAHVVIGTHKQAINERRPAIPNDLFAAWFAENDAPQVEEELAQDVVEQATPASTAVAPIVEEATAAPSVSDIPEPSGVLMESPVVEDSASSPLSERVDRDEAPIVEDLASSPVHESEGRAEVQEAEVPSQPKALSKEDERFCRKLERLVNTRMRNPNLNIDVIAAQFGMGRTNFYRKVRELMGMSPNDYLRKCRMERAAELLRTTVLPVADVCAQVGMPDAQYFSRVFKSYFGMPPSAYREQHD
ncbi:MAG: helix-turn-helix domain-containing protein [Bacteroidaceae bacterium]|nr:helix-turn-helix domain-containing protein [Bacteroidaceae bacterium]